MSYVLRGSSVAAIAALCHAANVAFCRSLGDDSQPDWSDAPDWQKASAIDGVNFHLANPGAGDAASHENWLKVKEADGWVFGETKDPEKKTHPCMVPFDQLPKEQQFKDTLFRTLVHQIAPSFAEFDDTAVTLEAKEADISNLKLKADDLETANGVLETERAALEKKLAAAKSAPTVKVAKPGKPRKIGPLSGEEMQPLELAELIQAASKVEIAFSDGEREIAGLPAREISGDAWAVGVAGLVLRADIAIDGQALPAAELAGYGLLLDGELVAYRARPEILPIGAGRMTQISNDVIF